MERSELSKTAGLPAGTPVYTGTVDGDPAQVTVVNYDRTTLTEHQHASLEQCLQARALPVVTWIDLVGVHDVETLSNLCEAFGVHPLVAEDIAAVGTRPKVEDYGTYIYVVLKRLDVRTFEDSNRAAVYPQQVSAVLGKGFVLTFHERPMSEFGRVRHRLENHMGRIRDYGADYLLFALLDAVVDDYFVELDEVSEVVDTLEDRLLDDLSSASLRNIHGMKRQFHKLRKAVSPLREVALTLRRGDTPLITEASLPYFRDLEDHVLQAIETVDVLRETSQSMIDLYVSETGNRMNEVMKVLTVVTTIFVPLSFITGLYGMNFVNMPELQWRSGYFVTLGVMFAMSLGMLLWFRHKRWL